jgi:hypothetical protein
MTKIIISRLSVVLVAFLAASCANNPLRSYKSETDRTITALDQNGLDLASQSLNNNDDVLYHLEYGSLLRMGIKYPQSESNFIAANAYVDAWAASYHNGTWGNIADTFQATLVNDNVLDYQIKDYEKVMMLTYRALNALNQGDWDGARIQIQRMYQLEQLIQNYRDAQYAEMAQKSQELPQNMVSYDQFAANNEANYDFDSISTPQVLALKNSYQNAFSHYLAGFVFEALGEDSLSRPGYLKALQLNPADTMINQSISNLDKNNKPGKNQTDLLLVEEIGHAPQIKSHNLNIPYFYSINGRNCANSISVSFPGLVPDRVNTFANTYAIDNQNPQPYLFTNINLMAARYLHDDLPNIFIRNILRATRDMAAEQSACKNGSTLLNIAALGAGVILNRADERAWVMLPSQIYLSRVRVPRGKHTITVNTALGQKTLQVNLTGAYHIVSWRVIGNQVYFSPDESIIPK